MMDKPYLIDGKRVTRDEYNRAKFERFLVTVPKGEHTKIKAYAQEQGMSVNAYIVQLIKRDMDEGEG